MQALKGGVGFIDLAWSNFTLPATTMAFKLCYTDDKILDRPWRKFKGEIEKNKQCWQTAKLEKFLGPSDTAWAAAGSLSIALPMNTAPSTYTVQVFSRAGIPSHRYTRCIFPLNTVRFRCPRTNASYPT